MIEYQKILDKNMLNVLKDILILSSSPWFIGTLCFSDDGNNISSPGLHGSIKDSEFT